MAEDTFEQKRAGDALYSVGRYPNAVGGDVDPVTGNAVAPTAGLERSPAPLAPLAPKLEPVKEQKEDKGGLLQNAVLGAVGGLGAIGGALGGIAKVGRVICSELHAQGLLDAQTLAIDTEYSRQHISHITARGYHAWAVPYVRLMRRSPLATKAALPIARWRAEELAFQVGLRARPCWRGKVVRWVFEPLCWLIGLFVAESEYSQRYVGGSER
ncbi:MAG: hypothetical protein IPK75_18955 [Acidobacteria bacterium]|nr:hypothetical protein [Acidobacteriota bacterium]